LEPLEARCLDNLRAGGARRLVVFGDGAAGQALARVLVGAGFEVLAFAATSPRQDECQGLPLVALEELSRWRFDRLVVGTQAFFEVEAALASADPRHDPLFPVVD
jgi:predicted dinucleotide-binding enzyme